MRIRRSVSRSGTTAVQWRSSPSRPRAVRDGIRSWAKGICARTDGPARVRSTRAPTGASRQDMACSFRVPRGCRQQESTLIPSRHPGLRQAGREGEFVEVTRYPDRPLYSTGPVHYPATFRRQDEAPASQTRRHPLFDRPDLHDFFIIDWPAEKKLRTDAHLLLTSGRYSIHLIETDVSNDLFASLAR